MRYTTEQEGIFNKSGLLSDDHIRIYIGDNIFRLSEGKDGLVVNKILVDEIKVIPVASNVVRII